MKSLFGCDPLKNCYITPVAVVPHRTTRLPKGFTPRFIPAMVYVVLDGSSTICSKSRFQILRILSIQIGMTIPDARIRLTNARLGFSVFKIVVFVFCWHPFVAKFIH